MGRPASDRPASGRERHGRPVVSLRAGHTIASNALASNALAHRATAVEQLERSRAASLQLQRIYRPTNSCKPVPGGRGVPSSRPTASNAAAPLVLGPVLGEGATARVYHARRGSSDVAAKVFLKSRMDAEELQWARDEIAILSSLHHHHVSRLHGVVESARSLTVLLTLARGGSLCDELGRTASAGGTIDPARSRALFSQLLGALVYCHRSGVVHGDVKLENVCFADAARRRVMLIDFGCAETRNECRGFRGSRHYTAPEVFAGLATPSATYCGTLADGWSCGVVLFCLLATRLPFGGPEETEAERAALEAKVLAGAWDVQPACEPDALELLRGLLHVDPDARATLEDAARSGWLRDQRVPWRGLDEVDDGSPL